MHPKIVSLIINHFHTIVLPLYKCAWIAFTYRRGYIGGPPQHQGPPMHMAPPDMRGPHDMRGGPMMGEPRGPMMEQRGPPMEARGI